MQKALRMDLTRERLHEIIQTRSHIVLWNLGEGMSVVFNPVNAQTRLMETPVAMLGAQMQSRDIKKDVVVVNGTNGLSTLLPNDAGLKGMPCTCGKHDLTPRMLDSAVAIAMVERRLKQVSQELDQTFEELETMPVTSGYLN